MDANDKKPDMQRSEPVSQQAKQKRRSIFLKTFQVATEFGFIIALPLIAFGKLGRYLDAKNGSKYFTLIGVLLALAISCLWIYRRIKDILKDLRNQ